MGQREEHRYFDKDFKYEAIRLMNEGNRSVKDIAGDLGIHPNLLHQWRRKYRADIEMNNICKTMWPILGSNFPLDFPF